MSDSLCWSCERAGRSECEWMTEDKPVLGWEAIPTTVLLGNGLRARSYCVKSCPKFKRYHERRKCEIVRRLPD